MAAAVLLRDDFDGPALRRLAKGTKDAAQARRLSTGTGSGPLIGFQKGV
jgi:hypothetical protein